MKAYVIHNPLRTDRFKTLQFEAETQGFEFELIDAIMHKNPLQGCRAAQQSVVQLAKEKGLKEVLIMEDDVRFCGPGAFKYFLKKKPKDYHLYNSGASFYLPDRFGNTKEFSGLQAFIVHEKFYDAFLSIPDDPVEHIDYQLRKYSKIITCLPFASIQYPGYSDNVQSERNYNKDFLRYPLYNNFQP